MSTYTPILSELERRSYEAAHEIVSADLAFREIAIPSHRRVLAVDAVAGILQKVFAKEQ